MKLLIVEELKEMLDRNKTVEENVVAVETRLSKTLWSLLKQNWDILTNDEKTSLITIVMKEF